MEYKKSRQIKEAIIQANLYKAPLYLKCAVSFTGVAFIVAVTAIGTLVWYVITHPTPLN